MKNVNYSDNEIAKLLDVYGSTTSSSSDSEKTNLKPVVIYLHGGAWHIGSKKKAGKQASALSNSGEFLCIAPSYSLSNPTNDQLSTILGIIIIIFLCCALCCKTVKQLSYVLIILLFVVIIYMIVWISVPRTNAQHPDHIIDVAKALDWTIKNAKSLGGDPERIYIMGHSAGGHLASLLATNDYYTGKNYDKIKGCIAISGVYNDKRLLETRIGTELLKSVFGARPSYYDAFPIYNVSAKTPPHLLINSGVELTLERHTLDMHYTLRQAGVYVETAYFPDKAHWNIVDGWSNSSKNNDNPVLLKIIEFIKNVETLN